MSMIFNNKTTKPSDNIHFLPCKIDTNGYAPVSTFFDPLIQKKNEIYTTSFRGREFHGKEIKAKIQLISLNKEKDTMSIAGVKEYSKNYVWLFDQYPGYDNKLVDIQNILSKFDVLG